MATRKKKYLADPDLSSRYDFDLRKCIHVRLYTKTKNELDVMKSRLNLTVQDIFECFANAVVDGDPYLISMLNEYKIKKDNSESERLFSGSDAETLFSELAKRNPFGNK